MTSSVMNQNHHVTAVITHRVRSGREAGYEEWIKGISADARQFAGHLGVNILRPQPGNAPSDYVIVLQFDTCDHLNGWLNSDIRKGWIENVQPLIQEKETIQVLTGLEGWFQLPTQPIKTAPKRYKQAVLVWVGVMLVSLLVSPLIAPLLSPLPMLLRTAISVAVTVVLLTYVIMPQLTRWFQKWLFA
ncbi:MAG: antibiotic biosynthesis monooxygenase [Cyanobacteria bacterium J06638_20]